MGESSKRSGEPDADTDALYVVTRPPPGHGAALLIDVPHAGTLEPPELARTLRVPFEARRHDLDLCVDTLYQDAPQRGATLMVARYSRYVVDLNRAPDAFDASSVEGAGQPAGRFRRGVIWSVDGAERPVLARRLHRAELEARLARYHAPYHARLASELARLEAEHGHVVLLDAHSMPAFGRAPWEVPGEHRADVVPGDALGRSCAPSLTALCVEVFSDHGFVVAPNAPYRGGYVTRHYGRPAQRRHALQLELNRRLFLEEVRGELSTGPTVARLRRALAAFVEAVVAWRPD